ncbi:GNAT family N-acetyltransferase [Flagellimonas sp. DF-77]|uniref:GNAT family N-acetyltransferase n=1 Tax=Flagellimonas algarum TaxID=3230298 RepID=UPI00339777AA
MSLRLEACTLNDVDLLVKVSRATFKAAFEAQNDADDFAAYLTTAFSKETLADELTQTHTDFYFCHGADGLVGYMKLNAFDAQSELREPEGMELERIYVLPEFQNRKIGQYLLQQALDIAKARSKRYLWLGVWERNLKAIRFYERHGFEKFGTHPYLIGADEQTDWLMRKTL